MKTGLAIAIASSVLALATSVGADESHSDDPMLAPIANAREQIVSWDDALARIRRAPDYLAQLASVELARGERRIALASALPSLTAVGSYQHSFNTLAIPLGPASITVPAPNVWTIEGLASWTIDARSIYGVGTADRRVDAANLSVTESRRELALATVNAILGTLTAERIAELDRTSLRAALDRLALANTRLNYAHGTELDVDRATQDVEAARALLVTGDEAVRQARESLGELIGSSAPIAAAASLEIEGFERAIAATCSNTDVEHRADVREAQSRLDIAMRGVNDARLRFAPNLNVSSQVSDANVATLGPTSEWTIGAAISIPLYDGGARYGALREAHANVAAAEQQLVQTRVAAIVDAARSDRGVSVATQSRDVAKRERDLAARVDERVREGYAAGLGTSLDLVTSAQALRSTEIELATAEFQVARARAGAVLSHAECVF